jgi:hypothetical protein
MRNRIALSDFSMYIGSVSKFMQSSYVIGESYLNLKLFSNYLSDYYSYLDLEDTRETASADEIPRTIDTIEI